MDKLKGPVGYEEYQRLIETQNHQRILPPSGEEIENVDKLLLVCYLLKKCKVELPVELSEELKVYPAWEVRVNAKISNEYMNKNCMLWGDLFYRDVSLHKAYKMLESLGDMNLLKMFVTLFWEAKVKEESEKKE